ncbi:hypothetical protein [Polymorphospora rubra]|uniref:Secreted protein n=1 Tax=Polymorphospora rubra TaxID=338584 RepID=A0A810NAC6_9ACTN|nr:hypothetical protein [Polymorphospora rubra]BCJ70030.1 hypothetical protein Prubr_70510 [Polymorphospora rubra]
MKRLLARTAVVTMAVAFGAALAAPAQASALCDRPIPPPACDPGYEPEPTVRDSAARGSLDGVTYVGNAVRVGGWAYDADSGSSPLLVDIYIDGVFKQTLTANTYRPDVAQVHPSYGAYRGYEATIPAGLGTHQVCAYAISVVPSGVSHPGNPQLGCQSYTARLAAPTNLSMSRNADGVAQFTFVDNSVEETSWRLQVKTQRWENRWDPRLGMYVPHVYYTYETTSLQPHTGTGQRTVTVPGIGSMDCGFTLSAVAGSFQSAPVNTGWC